MAGDRIVVGHEGVRVHAPERDRHTRAFEFMNSEVSSEKPKALLVRQVADRVRACRERGATVLAVCGPAVIHTGGGPAVAQLVRDGWIDVLFAGNGFATHDMESNVLGTSSACRSTTATAPRAVTPTTSGSSTRSAATGRSPPRSRPATSPAA